MTHAELVQLAQDVAGGKVFGSWMIAPEHLIYLERVFVPLQNVAKGQGNLPEDVSVLYEYREKAWPLNVEGYPVFFSMKFLTKGELVKLQAMLRTIQSLKAEFDIALSNLDEDSVAAGS